MKRYTLAEMRERAGLSPAHGEAFQEAYESAKFAGGDPDAGFESVMADARDCGYRYLADGTPDDEYTGEGDLDAEWLAAVKALEGGAA